MAEFDDSFTGRVWMFVFIFIRLTIKFWRKVGFTPIYFCNENIWIYQITKPCKQLKKLPNNATSYLNVVCIHIDLNLIYPMKPSKFKISLTMKSYDEKTTENYRNF